MPTSGRWTSAPALVALGLCACGEPRLDPFGTGAGDTGSSGGTVDTGGDGGSDECPGPSPCIIGLAGAFIEDTATGDVIELQVSYVDPEDDVQGGLLIFALTEDEEATQSFEAAIDGVDAWIVGANIVTRVGPVKTASTYEVHVVVQDLAGNQSDTGELVVP
jgi:hypothetical protein